MAHFHHLLAKRTLAMHLVEHAVEVLILYWKILSQRHSQAQNRRAHLSSASSWPLA